MSTPPSTLLEVLTFQFLKLLLSSSPVPLQVSTGTSCSKNEKPSLEKLWTMVKLVTYKFHLKLSDWLKENWFLILFKSFGTHNFKLFFLVSLIVSKLSFYLLPFYISTEEPIFMLDLLIKPFLFIYFLISIYLITYLFIDWFTYYYLLEKGQLNFVESISDCFNTKTTMLVKDVVGVAHQTGSSKIFLKTDRKA